MKFCRKYPDGESAKTWKSLEDVMLCLHCDDCFSELIGKNQTEQAPFVERFRDRLFQALRENLPEYEWASEWKPAGLTGRDSVDLYGAPFPDHDGLPIVIELDKPRADQVSKKALSRLALMGDKPFLYVSVCYVGTKHMNVPECEKYFRFIGKLCQRLKVEYVAFGIAS